MGSGNCVLLAAKQFRIVDQVEVEKLGESLSNNRAAREIGEYYTVLKEWIIAEINGIVMRFDQKVGEEEIRFRLKYVERFKVDAPQPADWPEAKNLRIFFNSIETQKIFTKVSRKHDAIFCSKASMSSLEAATGPLRFH